MGTQWSFLIFVCRTSQPKSWTDPAEYDSCDFWFGVVSRQDYEAALRRAPKDLYHRKEVSVTVTPGIGLASGGEPSRSWLGDSILWTRSRDMTPQWLDQTFGRG